METREERISLKTFFKRSWQLFALGALILIVLSVFLFSSIIYGNNSGNGGATKSEFAIPVSAPTDFVPRKLDGVQVSPQDAALQPLGVMVENSYDAWPLSGPTKANLVIEAPVEGGITRLLLVFDATSTVDQIGPVRSARPYYVDWAEGLQAVYAHVGGSPDALGLISRLKGFRNLDEFTNGKYFWRSSKRSMPHNTFTRTDLLRDAAIAKKWDVGSFHSWRYASSSDRGDVREIKVPYGGAYSVKWTFDADSNKYRRYQAGSPQNDADGTPVSASNVVVILTEEKVLDDVGRLQVRTTGSGKAAVYRNGEKISGVWRRQTGSWISFETVDGKDIEFEPGTTWISVVTSKSMLEGN